MLEGLKGNVNGRNQDQREQASQKKVQASNLQAWTMLTAISSPPQFQQIRNVLTNDEPGHQTHNQSLAQCFTQFHPGELAETIFLSPLIGLSLLI